MDATDIFLQEFSAVDGVSQPINRLERKLFAAIQKGDLEKFRTILDFSKTKCDLNCVNSSGKTLLQEAVDVEDAPVRSSIIKSLLSEGADLDLALLYVVRVDDVRSLKILLKFYGPPLSEPFPPLSPCIRKYSKQELHMTPLILAACLRNFQIVKLLLEHGFTICELQSDSQRPIEVVSEKLGPAMLRLNRYRALASPVYMAASFLQNPFSGPDPVHRACILNKKLSDIAEQEYEFRKEYLALSDGCKEFAVDLLNECRSMKEIRCVMEMQNEDKALPHVQGKLSLNILEFATVTENEKSDFLQYAIADWVIFMFVLGHIVDVVKQFYHVGRVRFFSSHWNYLAVATVLSFVLHYIFWWSGRSVLVKKLETMTWANHADEFSYTIVLVSDCFFAVAILLAFTQNLAFIQANATIGPLLQAFMRMMFDVMRFFFYFIFVFLAFVVSFTKLYLQYAKARQYFLTSSGDSNQTDPLHLESILDSTNTIFWSLFGQIDPSSFKISEAEYGVIWRTGMTLFGAFNITAVLVALNMLIAILNDSYVQITANLDAEWKLTRTRLWLNWISKKGVLPPPFNLVYLFVPIVCFTQHLISACCSERVLLLWKRLLKKKQKISWKVDRINEKERREVIRSLILRNLAKKSYHTEAETEPVDSDEENENEVAVTVLEDNCLHTSQFHDPSSPKRMSPDSMSLKYQRHFTPLILAARLQNFKIVKLLLEHGFSIPNLPIDLKKPVGSEINFDEKLGLTLFRLNRYRALASPVYMAASFLQNPFSDPDPVHRACALSKELSHMAEREHEFRQEYLELSDGCKEFTVDLLNGCRSMKEIRCVMEMENEKSTPLNTDGVVLNILEFAIVTRNEKFVSHPYSQLVLKSEALRHVPFLENSPGKRFTVVLLSSLLSPLIFAIWLAFETFLPRHKVARMFHSPCLKFLTNCGAYQIFLFVLTLTSFQRDTQFLEYSINDWIVVAFVIGHLVDFVKEVFQQGRVRFFANKWNYLAVVRVTLFVLCYVMGWFARTSIVDRGDSLQWENHSDDRSYKVVLFSECVFAVAILLAFAHNFSFIEENAVMGPLLQAFILMLFDVMKFFFFFVFAFLAFVVSFTKLYLQYEKAKDHFISRKVITNETDPLHLERFSSSVSTIFWSLFGQIDRDNFKIDETEYETIWRTGMVLFGAFNIVAVLVALNMLIAMLNESYTRITVNATLNRLLLLKTTNLDTEWNFTRTKLWLSWLYKKGILTSPCNLLYLVLPLFWVLKNLLGVCCPRKIKRISPDSMSLKYHRHFTPLILAACLQNFKIVKLLLEHGFSIPNLPIGGRGEGGVVSSNVANT
ncbi:hypothetical protein pdam_00005868 [Pocillopora damicornis]|uniref:Transient receptor ion channel domain-containing protein n=1 Tax=Pocillopora damicornis TaxID=46731 RepID=A0A3M6U6L8_POCDA|nr:hypothetical protein pdam_00005868 [Pocillopora damicornis]